MGFLFGSGAAELAGLSARLERVERKLDALLEQLGIAPEDVVPDPVSDPRFGEVRELVAAGRKIEAIKVYRELTGAGLFDAKVAVDEMERRGR